MSNYRIIGRTKSENLHYVINSNFSKEQYKNVRNLAWKFLLEFKIKELPLNLEMIADVMNVKLVCYERLKEIGAFKHEVETLTAFTAQNTSSLAFGIFYDNSLPICIQRFSIAHEIAHVYLKHKNINDTIIEKEANMFAARILMPICVLHELRIRTANEICKICNVSIEAANFRFKRLKMLENRNKFYSNNDENLIKQQFEIFILNYNLRRT